MQKFEKSHFDKSPSVIDADLNLGDEDLIPLSEFIDASKIMDYEDLKEAFESAIGVESAPKKAAHPRTQAARSSGSVKKEADLPFDDLPGSNDDDDDAGGDTLSCIWFSDP